MPSLFKIDNAHRLPLNPDIVDKDGRRHFRTRERGRTAYYPLTSDGKKYLKPGPKWHAEVRHADGRRKRVPLSPNRAAAERMLADLLRKIEEEKAGIRTPETDTRAKPLATHLDDWEASLRASHCGDEYVRWKLGRVRRVFDGCGFDFPRDLAASPVEQFLHTLRESGGRSVQTSNDHLQAVKQFARWMIDNDRLPKNPFARLKPGNAATDERHRRGELTNAEIGKLLATAAGSPGTFRGLTGTDRVAIFRTALGTGFRAEELSRVTAEGCSLAGPNPTITLPAPDTKNKKLAVQPISRDLAEFLLPYVAGKTGPLWPGTWPTRSADMLTDDLAAAGIAYTVVGPQGTEHRDFHALRNCFISAVIRSGADLKQAMTLARHSDPRLTAGRYARTRSEELTAVVNRTPNLTPAPVAPSVAPSVAAGDDGRRQSETGGEDSRDARCEGTADGNGRKPCEGKGLRAGDDDQGQLNAERKGFEPLVRSYPHAALAKRCFRPLSHLSDRRNVSSRFRRRQGNTAVSGQRRPPEPAVVRASAATANRLVPAESTAATATSGEAEPRSCDHITTGSVSVAGVVRKTVTGASFHDSTNWTTNAARIAGRSSGNVTRRNTSRRFAPSPLAASSHSASCGPQRVRSRRNATGNPSAVWARTTPAVVPQSPMRWNSGSSPSPSATGGRIAGDSMTSGSHRDFDRATGIARVTPSAADVTATIRLLPAAVVHRGSAKKRSYQRSDHSPVGGVRNESGENDTHAVTANGARPARRSSRHGVRRDRIIRAPAFG